MRPEWGWDISAAALGWQKISPTKRRVAGKSFFSVPIASPEKQAFLLDNIGEAGMSKVFIIHENDAWVEPLRAAFARIGTPFEEACWT